MTTKSSLMRIAFVFAAIGSMAAVAPSARFHVLLRKSEPAKNDTLTTPPKQIKLWFSEDIELKLSSVTLKDAAGATIALAALTRRDTANAPVVVNIAAALKPSAYTVVWRAPGDDGHPSTGTFAFVVRAKP